MQRDNTNKASVKDILSRISQDEDAATAVVEEVRNILVRDLQTAGAGPRSALAPSAKGRVGPRSDRNTDATNQAQTSPGVVEQRKSDNFERKENDRSNNLQQKDDEEELAFTISKDSDTYRNIYSMVQWYRDSFLVGSEFADERSAQRERENNTDGGVSQQHKEKKFTQQFESNHHPPISLRNSFLDENRLLQLFANNNIPLSKFTGVGYPYLLSYAQGYIPSQDVVNMLRPTALWAVSPGGPMLPTATQSLAQSIPLAQSSSDWVMRDNLLWVLQDEEWREFAKSITTKYVRSYKDD